MKKEEWRNEGIAVFMIAIVLNMLAMIVSRIFYTEEEIYLFFRPYINQSFWWQVMGILVVVLVEFGVAGVIRSFFSKYWRSNLRMSSFFLGIGGIVLFWYSIFQFGIRINSLHTIAIVIAIIGLSLRYVARISDPLEVKE